jgi:hypothetical protein
VVNGTCDASIEEAGDELGTTRMSEFRVVFRVAVAVFDIAIREVSLRAMKGSGRGGSRSQVAICLVTNIGYKSNRLETKFHYDRPCKSWNALQRTGRVTMSIKALVYRCHY